MGCSVRPSHSFVFVSAKKDPLHTSSLSPPQLKTHIPLSMVSEAICAFLALSKSTSGYHPGSRRSRCYRRQGLHPPPCLSDVSRGNVTDRMRFEHQTRSTLVRTYGTNDTVQQSATGRCEQQTTEGFRTRGISNQRFSINFFFFLLFFQDTEYHTLRASAPQSCQSSSRAVTVNLFLGFSKKIINSNLYILHKCLSLNCVHFTTFTAISPVICFYIF